MDEGCKDVHRLFRAGGPFADFLLHSKWRKGLSGNCRKDADLACIGDFIGEESGAKQLDGGITELKNDIVSESANRNQVFFEEEMDKLDSWASDMKVSLEREITDLDAEIKLKKSEAKKMTQLKDKVAAQMVIKDLEKKRAEKRQNLYQAQDEVDEKKEELLTKVEKMLEQKIEMTELFTIRWRVI